MLTPKSIEPRILPRDMVDVMIGVPHGLFFGLVIPVLVAGSVGFVLGRLGFRALAIASAAAVWLGFAAFVMCWTVRRLILQADGIRFVRVIGLPKFVPWADVVDIVPVPRSEVVKVGWFSAPFADASPALTAKGHYRFRFRSGVQYFPPRDATEFEEAVRRYREAAQQRVEADEAEPG